MPSTLSSELYYVTYVHVNYNFAAQCTFAQAGCLFSVKSFYLGSCDHATSNVNELVGRGIQ